MSLTRHPNLLETVLGSCIGLVMFDEADGIGGMAHVLLPKSDGREKSVSLPGKYADIAVPLLKRSLIRFGANERKIVAKIAGGARMFTNALHYENRDIGAENVAAVIASLKSENVPVTGLDVGGHYGRKMKFELETFTCFVEDFSERKKLI